MIPWHSLQNSENDRRRKVYADGGGTSFFDEYSSLKIMMVPIDEVDDDDDHVNGENNDVAYGVFSNSDVDHEAHDVDTTTMLIATLT